MYLHFSNFFLVFMIVGLVGEAVVIAEDFRPLIPPLFLSPDNISHPSSVHDIQLISECRLSISLEIGRVVLSPQEFPIDILLSLLAALDVAGEEAEGLRFWERVTALLVISSIRYSGRQRLIESLLVRVGEVWASPEWYMASADSMLKSVEEA